MLMVSWRGAAGAAGALGVRGLAPAVALAAAKPVPADKLRTRAAAVRRLVRMMVFRRQSCDDGPSLSNRESSTVQRFAISLSAQSWTLTQAANSATPDNDLLTPVCALASTLPLSRSTLTISPEKKLVANTCVAVTGSDMDAQPKPASG